MSPPQAHTSAVPAASAMTHPSDTQPDPALASDASTPASAADPASRPRVRDQIAENPLLSLFGAVIVAVLGILGAVVVALLTYTLTTTQSQFASIQDQFASIQDQFAGVQGQFVGIQDQFVSVQEQFDRVHDRIDRLEDKIDEGFATQGAMIEQINLKLTALIAALNMTTEIDAALEGRLLSPAPAADGPSSERSP